MIACVGSTNIRGVLSSLTSSSQIVSTLSSIRSCSHHKAGEGLEVQSELADIIGGFGDGELTCSGAARSVGTWIVWISDVSGVG